MRGPIPLKSSSEKGSAILGVLMVSALFAVLIGIFLTYRDQSLRSARHASRAAVTTSLTKSAIETFLLAWRQNEIEYYRKSAGCDSLRSFIGALRDGSGCATASATLLGKGMETVDAFDGPETYSYTTSAPGCRILPASSTCSNYDDDFLSMELATQQLHKHGFRFSLGKMYPSSQVIEINVTVTNEQENVTTKMTFALRDNFVNLVHLEPTGRITQERPDPLSRCPTDAWTTYLVFLTGSCRGFELLGSGTGIASYNNRYFGFRSQDGRFVDMAALTGGGSPSSYIVKPDGTVDGLGKVFVPYPDPADPATSLRNVDDVTLIDEQIYYVAHLGTSAHLGVAAPKNGGFELRKVCGIGDEGWAQAYAGLAVAAWSEPLVRTASDVLVGTRYAKFFLKTDAGDLLTTIVESASEGVYKCMTFKDAGIQHVEYRRTMGFDRSVPEKIYFLY